ncbi:MAG: hypothetical protein WBP44_14290, partial [Gammaproteobacteria bacterium]
QVAILARFFLLACFAFKGEVFFDSLFRPFGRDTFLCSAKEKYPKERRSRRLARCAGPLRFS